MKNRLALLAALVAIMLVAGCETSGITNRIQEKSVVFNNLAPWQRRDIQNGVVDVGFSTDMVYMALGKPSKIVTSANGKETVWTYNNYYPPTARHEVQMEHVTAGGADYKGSYVSANSPRSGVAFSSTNTRDAPQMSLGVADMPSDTLYITFVEGQVVQTKLESENR